MVKRQLRDKFRNKRAAMKRQRSPEARATSVCLYYLRLSAHYNMAYFVWYICFSSKFSLWLPHERVISFNPRAGAVTIAWPTKFIYFLLLYRHACTHIRYSLSIFFSGGGATDKKLLLLQAAPSKLPRVCGLPNYAPVGGLDGVALLRKVNELNSAGADDVDRLLDETFEGRRRKILSGGLAEVLQDYPKLFDGDGVSIRYFNCSLVRTEVRE